ncbi:sialic acid-binding Ig-like lectin 8 [Xenopus laevis]|uniref:Sialic acid-binding Ig-like lectin 8 n=1 Tax=Xenopus laevis TaxID=8355 RepID=A0A8J0T3R9_XENLA|nr:sialic acid-binding Ig-like lectin 8 [Xenopus laevis]
MGKRGSWCCWEYLVIILLFFSMQWKGRNCQRQTKEALPGFKIEAPAEVTVQRGLCVLIPCNFTVGPGYTLTKDAIGIWNKINGPVAASTDSSQFSDTTNGRFIFTGKVSAGDCSFSISDAQPGDTDQYWFRLEDKYPLKFTYVGIKPSVSVTDLKEPDISPTKDLIAGEEVTVTCTAPTHCPGLSPTFTWEGSVNTENTQNNKLRHQDGNFTYWSNITFTPSPSDHNSSLTCTVTYKHGSATTSITLNVIYLPILNITVPGGTGERSNVSIKEGDSQEIYCKVNSNPMANISWTKGKIPVENTKQNGQKLTLLLKNVTENDTDIYTCTAQNQRGINNRSISVSVEYAPRQPTICVDKPEGNTVCLAAGNITVPAESALTLQCVAKSNPPANFSWIQSNPFNKHSGNRALMVQVLNDIEYTCQAENKYGLSNISIIIIVTPAQKPQTNLLIVGLCILFFTLVLTTLVFVYRGMRKKKDLQEDTTTKEMPKSDGDVIYNNVENMKSYSNESYINTEGEKPDKDDLYMNYEKELQYASLNFSKIKPMEAPQTEIIYSEVKRN